MKHKLILLAFAVLLALPLVSAAQGIVLKVDTQTDFNLQIYDSNGAVTTSSVNCNMSLSEPNGSIVIRNREMTFNPGGIYNVTILPTEIRNLGEYEGSANCDNGGDFGFSNIPIFVTGTGSMLTTGQALIYIVVIIMSFGIFLLSLFGTIATPYSNETTPDGQIIGVSNLKFVKISLAFITYIIGVFMAWLAWNITSGFLFFNVAANFFRWIFFVLMALLGPLFIVLFVMIGVIFLNDKKLKKALTRGVPIR